MGWVGHALTIGVTGPESTQLPGEPSTEDLPSIPHASEYADELWYALQGFDYIDGRTLCGDMGDPRTLSQALQKVVVGSIVEAQEKSADSLIVHVLSHGTVKDDKLHLLVGDDGGYPVDVNRWLNTADDDVAGSRPPHALFIFDACHSGRATRHLSINIKDDPADQRVFVIAAARAHQYAFKGNLTKALTKVLCDYQTGYQRYNGTNRYISLNAVVEDLRRELDRLQSDSPFRQEIEATRVELGDRRELPFFPNPTPPGRGDELLSAIVDIVTRPILDTIPLLTFPPLGNGNAIATTPAPSRVRFQGRATQLKELSDWMNGEGSPLRLITGKPGVGKSALIGVLVAAAHPNLRKVTEACWSPLSTAPYEHAEGFCAVHARGRSLSEIVDGIARQLQLTVAGQANQLVDGLTNREGNVPTIVIDAVDESNEPEDVARLLLLPLTGKVREDGSPACRLLIGSRPEPWLEPLAAVGGVEAWIGLDDVDRAELKSDLCRYLEHILLIEGPYASGSHKEVRKTLITATVDALTGGDSDDRADCGEFLVAGMFGQLLRESPVPKDEEAAAVLGATVPRTLTEVLDLDLVQRPMPWFKPLLIAVAHARGDGLPELLIREMMRVTKYGLLSGEGPTTAELDESLETAYFYLRRAIDPDGRTLYRLFHQGLADRLREEPVRSDDAASAAGEDHA